MGDYVPTEFSGMKIDYIHEQNISVISYSGENAVDIQVLTQAAKLQIVIKLVLESSSK